jgi:restriction endonuclease S subunit
MYVDFPESTDIHHGWPPTWVDSSGKVIGSAIHAGQNSTPMVDLYGLPVRDLVEEIHRLVAIKNNLEEEITILQRIIEAGKRANEKQKRLLRSINLLTSS